MISRCFLLVVTLGVTAASTSAGADTASGGAPFTPIDGRSANMVNLLLTGRCSQIDQPTYQWTADDAGRCGNTWLKQCLQTHESAQSEQQMRRGAPPPPGHEDVMGRMSQDMAPASRWILRFSPAARAFVEAWAPVEQCASLLLPPDELKAIIIATAGQWAANRNYDAIAFCVTNCKLADDDTKQSLVALGADRGFEHSLNVMLQPLGDRINSLADDDDAGINDVIKPLDRADGWLAAHPDLIGNLGAGVSQKVASLRTALQARVRPGITTRLDGQLRGVDDALTSVKKSADTITAQEKVEAAGLTLQKVGEALNARKSILGTDFDGLQVRLTTLQQTQTAKAADLSARAALAAKGADLKQKLCSNAASLARIKLFQQQQARVDQATGTRNVQSERSTAMVLIQLGDNQAQVRRDLAAMGVTFSEANCPRPSP